MIEHLKRELTAEWHKLVTGSENDIARVLEWILFNSERKLLMTIETQIQTILDSVAALSTKVDALVTPTAVDLTPVLTAIAALDAKIGNPPA